MMSCRCFAVASAGDIFIRGKRQHLKVGVTAVNTEAAIRISRTTTFLRQAPAKAKTISFPLTGFSDSWLLRWDVHQVLVKTSDWTILNGCDRLIIRNKIRLYLLGNFTDVSMLDMSIHPFGTIEKNNLFICFLNYMKPPNISQQIVCKISQLCTSSMFLTAAFTRSFHWKRKKKIKKFVWSNIYQRGFSETLTGALLKKRFSELPPSGLQREHSVKGIKHAFIKAESVADHEEACWTHHVFHDPRKL